MKAVRPRYGRSPRSQGFTLVEMVLVLIILAVIAGLVMPLIGSLRTQSDRSSSAFGSAHIIENLEAFRISAGRYPERMDSLLVNDGTFVPYSRLADDTEAPGNWFNVEDLDSFTGAQYARSLNRAGITRVMDHDTTQTDPNASGRILRTLLPGDDRWFAVLSHMNSNSLLAAAGVADLDNDNDYLEHAIVDADGSGNPDVKYIAFGLGPQCEVVGQMMANAPLHFNAEPTNYGRFIIIFVAHESGAPASLRTVVDSRRIVIGRNVAEFRTFLGRGG
jgi:prepilin-type N-terminal cleavage/methylation domain-containing protein